LIHIDDKDSGPVVFWPLSSIEPRTIFDWAHAEQAALQEEHEAFRSRPDPTRHNSNASSLYTCTISRSFSQANSENLPSSEATSATVSRWSRTNCAAD